MCNKIFVASNLIPLYIVNPNKPRMITIFKRIFEDLIYMENIGKLSGGKVEGCVEKYIAILQI
jgi:hypothetical protein